MKCQVKGEVGMGGWQHECQRDVTHEVSVEGNKLLTCIPHKNALQKYWGQAYVVTVKKVQVE